MKTKKSSAGRDKIVKELQEKVENGVMKVLESNKWMDYLTTMSKFRRYSANNNFIIYVDCMMRGFRPSFTTGFKTWNSFNRTVKKGEKAIQILAPLIRKKKQEKELEEDEFYIRGFKYVSVFDLQQTEVIEGKEDGFKTICKELKGTSEQATELIASIKEICPIKIIEEDIQGRAKGYYSSKENKIAVKLGVSPVQAAKTLTHEYGHFLMNELDLRSKIDNDYALEEVVVESVAFIVNNYFGIDTSEYSFEYVASWSHGEADKIKLVANLTNKLSNIIIDQLESLKEAQVA